MKIDTTYKNAYTTAVYIRNSGMLSGFIDGLLVSAFLGVDAMTAYGIAGPYFTMVTIVSYLLVTGCQVLCSSKIGQNDTDKAKNVYATAIWISFFISALVSVTGIIFAEPFARFLGAKGNAAYLTPEVARYLRFLFASNIFHNFVSISTAVLQIDGGAKLVRTSGLVICGANVLGDILSIFVFKGGLAGIGASTIFSKMCGTIVLLPYFFRKNKLFSIHPKYFRTNCISEILRLGYSQTVYGLASFFGNTLINRLIISEAGLDVMFGYTVFKNTALFINPFCNAVGDANLLLFGMRIGEGDREGVEKVFHDSIQVILCLIPLGLLLVLLSRPFAGLYTMDRAGDAFKCAQAAILALGIQTPFSALFLGMVKGLQAFGNSKMSSVMNLAKACVFPCALLLFFAKLKRIGVFGSLVTAEFLSAVLTTIFFVREKQNSSMLSIPEENILSADFSTIKGAVDFSVASADFCRIHGMNSKFCYFIPLCAEELGICLLNLGMENEIKKMTVNAKIVFRDNKITLCFRDNSPLNDLRKRAEEWKPDDEQPERFIGTRIALKLSDEFKYIPLMDQNNTLITFNV